MTDATAIAGPTCRSLPKSMCHRMANGRFSLGPGCARPKNIHAVRCDGSSAPERLTMGADHYSIRDVSPDGLRLILGQSRNSCEHDHLLLLDRSSSALMQLTPEQTSHYVYGGIFSADGQDVIFTANFDYDAGAVTEGGWIWRQNLTTGARRCLARAESPFETGPKLSPSGRQLLWHRHEAAPAGTQLWVMNADGAGLYPAEVLNLGPSNNAHGVWLDDGRIAFVADEGGRDRLGVLTWPAARWRGLAGEPELYPIEVIAGARALPASPMSKATPAVCWLRAALSARCPTGRVAAVRCPMRPCRGWIAEAYDGDAPHQLVRVHPDGRCTALVTAPANPARQHIPPRDYRWTAPDGRAMQGWLYEPKEASKGFIAYVHGGPTWHSEDWVNPLEIGYWVQKGYTVFDPNYRGSTGFGYAHREAVKEDGWGGREQADIRAGIEQALADGLAVRGKIRHGGQFLWRVFKLVWNQPATPIWWMPRFRCAACIDWILITTPPKCRMVAPIPKK